MGNSAVKHLVLLIEDSPDIHNLVRFHLRKEAMTIKHAYDGMSGMKLVRELRPNLILLDVELPGLNGFEILKAVREAGGDSRILMLTARGSELDRVLGFEYGVDDYVCKPFSLAELLGRIKALLRRSLALEGPPQQEKSLVFGDVRVDLDGFKVIREGEEVRLPAKAFDLLRFLVEHSGEVVSRDQLIDRVWGEEECITQRTLNNLVVKIRQAIEQSADEPTFLKTVHGVGYRLDL